MPLMTSATEVSSKIQGAATSGEDWVFLTNESDGLDFLIELSGRICDLGGSLEEIYYGSFSIFCISTTATERIGVLVVPKDLLTSRQLRGHLRNLEVGDDSANIDRSVILIAKNETTKDRLVMFASACVHGKLRESDFRNN